MGFPQKQREDILYILCFKFDFMHECEMVDCGYNKIRQDKYQAQSSIIVCIIIMEKERQEILYISFNQDQTYFAVGTQKGFRVYKLSRSIEQVISREFGSGIGIVEMIHKTNIFAIVGGGKTPRYPKNKLMIWDDSQAKAIIQTSCKSQVKAVRLNPERCIIVLETKIFAFNLADFRVIEILQTCPNPKGLCAISAMRDLLMLAYPTKKLGTVEILVEGEEKRRIDAHKSTVYALELCPNGGKLATASEKGTIIRIFNVRTCECMQELRRGSEYATIYSIAFDLNSEWLACSSDSGTVHIFGLRRGQEEGETKNKKSKLSIFSKISSYFDSEWSFASYHTTQKRTRVGFLTKENLIAIISTSGSIHLVKFNTEKSGECEKVAEYNIFEMESKN